MNFLKLSLKVSFLSAILILTACHTVQGVGKDVQHTGRVIQRAAS